MWKKKTKEGRRKVYLNEKASDKGADKRYHILGRRSTRQKSRVLFNPRAQIRIHYRVAFSRVY